MSIGATVVGLVLGLYCAGLVVLNCLAINLAWNQSLGLCFCFYFRALFSFYFSVICIMAKRYIMSHI